MYQAQKLWCFALRHLLKSFKMPSTLGRGLQFWCSLTEPKGRPHPGWHIYMYPGIRFTGTRGKPAQMRRDAFSVNSFPTG